MGLWDQMGKLHMTYEMLKKHIRFEVLKAVKGDAMLCHRYVSMFQMILQCPSSSGCAVVSFCM